MKKLLTSILFYFLLVPNRVLAQTTIENPVDERFSDIPKIISNLSGYIQTVAVLGFLAMIIYGGFTKLTAAGDAEKEAKASKILTAGVVGFIIIVLAPLIVSIFGVILGVETITN